MDPSVVIDPETEKNNNKDLTGAISFEQDYSLKESPELISYIASQTGKIKALAAADLDSHLWLGQQFLNIGKPFILEGIGHLIKTQTGQLEFTTGQLHPEMLKTTPERTVITDQRVHENDIDYSTILQPRKEAAAWRRPLAFLLIIAGIGIAIWGGYFIYKKNSREETDITKTSRKETAPAKEVTVPTPAAPVQPDSNTNSIAEKTQVPLSADSGMYKFVVETAGKQRAFTRFQKLKSLPTEIQMETQDSVTYTLFFLIRATAADTTKMLDSLRTCYTPKWSQAYIKQ